MWWGRSSPRAQAWIGTRQVALQVAGQDLRYASASDRDQALRQLCEWVAPQRRKPAMQVWLCGESCQPAVVPALHGADDRAEAEQAVLAWLQAQGWPVADREARLPAWPCDGERWPAVVLPRPWLATLQAALGPGLHSVRPWWSWALQQAQRDHAAGDRAVCAFDGHALTVCHFAGAQGLVKAHTSMALPDEASLARQLLRVRAQVDAVSTYRLRWPDPGDVGQVAPGLAGSDADDFAFAPWVEHVAHA